MSDAPLYDAAFAEVMARRIGGTTFRVLEVYLLGEQLLNWINVTSTLGHTTPGHSLEYIPPSGEIWRDMLRDFVAWTSGRKGLAPGCDDRLLSHIADSGWSRLAAERMSEQLPDTG